jgi:hypothetical protein
MLDELMAVNSESASASASDSEFESESESESESAPAPALDLTPYKDAEEVDQTQLKRDLRDMHALGILD